MTAYPLPGFIPTRARTLIQTITETTHQLAPCSETAQLDAEVLLAHALQQPRSYLYAWPKRVLTVHEQATFDELVAQRRRGVPVAYLTGTREFWSLPLRVTAATLIPRPETELLVELALEKLVHKPHAAIADLGTGSGAIALALANAMTMARVVGTDISAACLDVARENAERLGLKVGWRQGDWCLALAKDRFDLIIANPPYVCNGDPLLQASDLRHEPLFALAAGEHGLDAIGIIAHQARAHLVDCGWLILEHGYDQGPAVVDLLRGLGYADCRDYSDYAGISRACAARSVA